MTEPPVTTEVTEPSTETYSAEMNVCKKKGEIRGVNVEGCIATFDEQSGEYSYTGTTLENQQQVVAVRSYRYKERKWYDIYDIDYNIYYGWVDEKYITFYDESIQTTSTSTTTSTTTTTTVITTTTESVASSWQDAYRITLNNIRNSDDYESAYMWDLADLDGDTVPELLISSGFDRLDKVSIYYYDGKQAVLLDSNSDGKGDKFGEGGYMGLDGSIIESGYNYLGRSSYTYYRYHSDHTIERLKDFYTNEGFAKENGLAPDYKIDGEYVTPDYFYDIYYQMRPENYTRFTPVGRKYSFDDDSALG